MPIADPKREHILEAALKRFSHFGPSKTTMDEIAQDAEMSKGLLYYYFPDKEAICLAVVKRIVEGSYAILNSKMESPMKTSDLLELYLKLKEENYIRYQHILGMHQSNAKSTTSMLPSVLHIFREGEIDFMSRLIARGIKNGEISSDVDPLLVSGTLFDAMYGLRVLWAKEGCAQFGQICKGDIKVLTKRMRLLLTVFFNGLKKQ